MRADLGFGWIVFAGFLLWVLQVLRTGGQGTVRRGPQAPLPRPPRPDASQREGERLEELLRGLQGRLEQAGLRGDSLHTRAGVEWERDAELMDRSLNRYLADPIFLLKKLLLNSVWFWMLASSWKMSLLIGALQGALLFVVGAGIRRKRGAGSQAAVCWLPLWIALAYFVPHVLTFSLARFSVVLIPSLIAFAASTYNGAADSVSEA